MTDHPAIANPLVHVVMADASEWDVQTLNQDIIRYETTAQKHGWGLGDKAPLRFTTFLAYNAAKRDGLIPRDLSWEEFSENGPRVAISIRQVTSTPVDPTDPAPGTG